MKENKYLEQARRELEHLSSEPDFKRLLESRAGFLRDVDTKLHVAREEGKEEGKRQKQIEIAKKMKLKDKTIEEIIDFTGLSKEEIENL